MSFQLILKGKDQRPSLQRSKGPNLLQEEGFCRTAEARKEARKEGAARYPIPGKETVVLLQAFNIPKEAKKSMNTEFFSN